ncbi:hypothetical protein [Streptacidiphilus sp. P02-A3a]|uniref:hypothetical protein n=1 Tax=Streptacidiphilus sp. P02-A3a TaxID=2704468 RepID=UPI0015FB03AF|nr:hypothetical protein [Streptacidiphilus sp. P02-A3a]QMU69146.1 hypothetical protein GXP74_13700 [Streptacidiphilus sp. P02-A3a]
MVRSTPPAPSPGAIGIRARTEFSRERQKVLRIDPADYQCPALAGQLADAWLDYADKNAVKSSVHQRAAVVSLCTFAGPHLASLGHDPADARLDSADLDLAEVVYAWEQQLSAGYAPQSNEPYRLANTLLNILDHAAQRDARIPERLRERARDRTVLRKRTAQVLDEYSNSERLALREAAMEDIRAMEKRLAAGRLLLEAGRDPREKGWLTVPQLLWAARNGTLTTASLYEYLPEHAQHWPAELRELRPAERGPFAGRRGLAVGVCRMLFPSEIDLHPFRVLLLLSMTDCTSEELHGLRVPEIEFSAQGARIVQTKNRASRVRADFHLTEPEADPQGDEGAGEKAFFEGGGQWDVPGLLRRLVAANELTRQVFDCKPWLFTAVELTGKGVPQAELGYLNVSGRRFTDWIAAHGEMDISQPHDARRLRKTAKTTRVAALGGTLSDLAGDDHHIQVFAGHYAHGTTAHTLAARAVNSAQRKVFDRITTKPILVDPDAEAHLSDPETADALGITVQQGRALMDGELDMGLTNCREPTDSPFTGPGKPCHVAPAMCMVCPNAVIFTSQLPRLLLFADHVERMRERLTPPVWQLHWGQKAQALAELFEECAEHIPAAREQIAAGAVDLDLPLGMRTEYDR